MVLPNERKDPFEIIPTDPYHGAPSKRSLRKDRNSKEPWLKHEMLISEELHTCKYRSINCDSSSRRTPLIKVCVQFSQDGKLQNNVDAVLFRANYFLVATTNRRRSIRLIQEKDWRFREQQNRSSSWDSRSVGRTLAAAAAKLINIVRKETLIFFFSLPAS